MSDVHQAAAAELRPQIEAYLNDLPEGRKETASFEEFFRKTDLAVGFERFREALRGVFRDAWLDRVKRRADERLAGE